MVTQRDIYKKFGNSLIEKGIWFLKNAFQVKVQQTTSQYVKSLVSQKTGIPISNIWVADDTYYYVDIATIKDILKYDLVDEKEYEAEKYDCDDFAATIYAIFRYIFEINTMGFARQVEIRDATTNQNIGWHRANLFVASENNELKVFYLEPQTDQIVEMVGIPPRNEVLLNNKKYVLSVIDF